MLASYDTREVMPTSYHAPKLSDSVCREAQDGEESEFARRTLFGEGKKAT